MLTVEQFNNSFENGAQCQRANFVGMLTTSLSHQVEQKGQFALYLGVFSKISCSAGQGQTKVPALHGTCPPIKQWI